ncbi:MAG: AMP-binding protein [Flavobacteriaceae bacterium]
MKNNLFHSSFTLNNVSFKTKEALLEYVTTLSKSMHEFLEDWFSEKKTLSVKTSGSTGVPKWIELEKKHMVNSAIATGSFFNLPEHTSALLCLPTEYIAGKMMLVRALVLGWQLDYIEPVSTPLENIYKTYDFSAMVPLQLKNSLDKIHFIKKLIVGGGEVSIALENQIQSVSTQIFATYGMTETITHIAAKKLNHSSQNCFTVLPNVTVSKDHRNCLVINASNISSLPIVTNDVVEIISETNFNWKGRYDHVINTGGIKLHPEVIERKLASQMNQRFFVTGVKDNVFGEKLVLFVEGEKTSLAKDIFKGLSKFEQPKEVFFVPKFMETETGKVQRTKTKKLF